MVRAIEYPEMAPGSARLLKRFHRGDGSDHVHPTGHQECPDGPAVDRLQGVEFASLGADDGRDPARSSPDPGRRDPRSEVLPDVLDGVAQPGVRGNRDGGGQARIAQAREPPLPAPS